jgi:Xaa-Pro aminopeptidase
MLVTEPADVSYLTGFTGEDSALVYAANWACLITDGRYSERAAAECGDLQLLVRGGGMGAAVAEAISGRGVRRLGVQAETVTLYAAEALQKAVGGRKLIAVPGLTARLREIKDDAEIRAIRKAVIIAQQAFRGLLAGGAGGLVGRSEREIAGELDYRMRLAGADAPSFETIVAAGRASSNPHYVPSSRRVKAGQCVLIDWGALVGGYCSDLTRVVFTGRIPPELAEPYEVVLRAQAAGIEAIRPGASCKAVDQAARKVIDDAGHGENFLHSLGHGLGRKVHEGPTLSSLADKRLKKGMVVTVEPGIYLPGVGGIRIEDDVLVTADGHKRLSSLPRQARAMVPR